MKIWPRFSRSRVAAGAPAEVDLLVRLSAPAPPSGAPRPPVAIVPIVDVSGSMKGPKLAAVRVALERLVAHLVPGDRLGLVTFADEAQVVAPLAEMTAARKAATLGLVRRLVATGGTNLAAGLEAGCELLGAALAAAARRRAVLLTDGRANQGVAIASADLAELARRRAGAVALPVSAFGYGEDCDHALLAEVAGATGYACIDGDDAVLTAFARELGGLLATFATGATIEVRPLGGAPPAVRGPFELLHHGEARVVATIALPALASGECVRACEVIARYRDAGGVTREVATAAAIDVVAPGVDLGAEDPEVVRARDEEWLRAAQADAEALAARGDLGGARSALGALLPRLADQELAAFVRDVLLSCYDDEVRYASSSGLRVSSLSVLSGSRQVSAHRSVVRALGTRASRVEVAAEASFAKGPTPGK